MNTEKEQKERKENAKLRIAMFGHKRVPSREGGIEVVVEELAARMVSLGHDVTCYNRRGHHVSGTEFDDPRVKEWKGIHIRYVPTIRGKGLSAVSASFFAALASAVGNYDVVHIHAEGPAYFAWIPKIFGKKVITEVHGLDWQRAKWGGLGAKFIKKGEEHAVKYSDQIVVLSKNIQEYFADRYGRKTVVVSNGVNRPTGREADTIVREYGLEKEGYILFLSRLVKEKGVEYLIEAYKQLDTEKKLVIAGGASDSDEYMEELKKICIGYKKIIFTGFVKGEKLQELYSNAYLYVLPSDLEGMPIALLEAMSYGNCCVVSDISECVEVVEDNAIVFEKSSVENLREKLQDLCDDSQKVEMYQRKAADYICRKFDWDQAAGQILDLHKKVQQT